MRDRTDRGKFLPLAEIGSVVLTAVLIEWVLAGVSVAASLAIAALCLVFMVADHRLHGESLRDLGFRSDNFVAALKLVAMVALPSITILLLGGWYLGTLHSPLPQRGSIILWLAPLGIAWGVLQQYWIQSFINTRAMQAFGHGSVSIIVVAATFGLLHMPNPVLAIVTFLMGLAFGWIYQRKPNVYALGLAHSFLTLVFVSSLPDRVLGGLRVGLHYFQ